MIVKTILLIIGFAVLIKGADIFVDGAKSIAGNLKISRILIGLTIVAFGTSAPEMAVSIKAMINGSGDIVLGNVIGSNILNTLLIIGTASLFHSLVVKNNTVKKELPITILISTLLSVLLLDNFFDPKVNNALTRNEGIAILLFFMIFIYYLFTIIREKQEDNSKEIYLPMIKAIIFTISGIIAIIIGSNLVVDNATKIAKILGISEKIISLTIISIGTSLPELVTSITATKKGEYDIAIGNVVGSNIFNIGLVLAMPIALFGGIYNITFNIFDIVTLIASCFLLYIFAKNDQKITYKEGLTMLLMFAIYYTFTIIIG